MGLATEEVVHVRVTLKNGYFHTQRRSEGLEKVDHLLLIVLPKMGWETVFKQVIFLGQACKLWHEGPRGGKDATRGASGVPLEQVVKNINLSSPIFPGLWGSGCWCGTDMTAGSTSRLRQHLQIGFLNLQGFLLRRSLPRRRTGNDNQNLIPWSMALYLALLGILPWYQRIMAIVLDIDTFISIGDFFQR